LIIISLACGTVSKNESPLPLPSGGQVFVISLLNTHYPNGDYAIELNYRTNTSLDDRRALKNELYEVWSTFLPYAEKQGAGSVLIKVHEPPKGFMIKTNKSETFLFKKLNNQWVKPNIQQI